MKRLNKASYLYLFFSKFASTLIIAYISFFIPGKLHAQEEIGVECNGCENPNTKAIQVATQMNLSTNDQVNVIDSQNGWINSFRIIRTVVARSGNVIFLATSVQTPENIQNAYQELIVEIVRERERITKSGSIDLSTVDNPCVFTGPGGAVFERMSTVWDLVGCEAGKNKLENRLPEFIETSPSITLYISNFASMFTAPVNIKVPIAIQFPTSDGGLLHFDLVYNIINGDELILSAELNEEKSQDALGNNLSAASGGNGQMQGTYFAGHNNDDIRTRALLGFIQAAQRLGLVVRMGGSSGGPIQTKCVPNRDGGYTCSPV